MAIRAAFMGTPEFAVASLEATRDVCAQSGGELVALICQPDRPVGRGQVLSAPPTKVRAIALNIPVWQPTKMRDGSLAAMLRSANLDVIVVAAYGRILAKDTLESARVGCVNVHASLLPKYRGAAPIQWSIVNGESETGVTLMAMEEGLDTGAMFVQRTCPIEPTDTAFDLSPRLAQLGAQTLRDCLPAIVDGTLLPVAQDSAHATLAPLLRKEDGHVQWLLSATEIERRVRGLYPWPTTFAMIHSKQLKILRAHVVPPTLTFASLRQASPGTIVFADKSAVVVLCGGHTFLCLDEVQLEGKKRMAAQDLVFGRQLQEGWQLT